MKHYTPQHRERVAIFSDMNHIYPTLLQADKRFHLPDFSKPIRDRVRARLLGMTNADFEQLSLERKYEILSGIVLGQNSTLDHLVDRTANSAIKSFARRRRVKFDDQGMLVEDAWLTLGKAMHIAVGNAGRLHWNTFIEYIDDQKKKQVEAAKPIIKHSRDIVAEFQRHPRCRSTSELFQKIGRAFADPVLFHELDDDEEGEE